MLRQLGILLCATLLLATSAYGQQERIDSLRTVFADESIEYNKRQLAGQQLLRMLFNRDTRGAREVGFKLLSNAEAKGDSTLVSTSHKLIGNTYAILANYDSALFHFSKSYKLSLALEDIQAQSVLLSNMGTVYYEMGNYSHALELLFQGLKIAEELADTAGLSRVTNNIGNVFIRQEEHEKALEYYTRSLELKEFSANPYGLATTHNNLGLVNTNLGNSDKAIFHLEKSIAYSIEIGDKISETRALNNIGTEYTRLGRYHEALDVYAKSLSIKKALNDMDGIGHTNVSLGICNNKMGRFEVARDHCLEGYDYARQIGSLKMTEQSCDCLAAAYEGLGDTKNALKYYRKFTAAKDSLFNKEITEEITRQEMLYDFDKQQLADSISFAMAQTEQDLQHKLDLGRQRTKLNVIVFGGLGLLAIGFVYWRSRQKGKELEQERRVIEKMKRVDELKDQFLANTSHELRTPLNGIIGLSESMKDGPDGALSQKAVEDLEMISSSGKRLLHLVNDILDFSKLKNEELNLSIRPVDVHTVADVVLKLCEPLTEGKEVKLINATPPDLPMVAADENRLQQIFYNLVGNGIKFTERGSITAKAQVENGEMIISIIDTGIGIAEKDMDSIFQSFEQVDGTDERDYEGTGLGLSISKQLVELHKGKIDVTSTLGEGATFTFSLPLSEETEAAKAKPTPSQGGIKVGGAVRLKSSGKENGNAALQKLVSTPRLTQENGLKVLVVDDEPVNRRVLNNHLTAAGYHVTEVTGGQEALDLIRGGAIFNIVLLDVMMPATSGYEVCRTLRQDFLASELPIVLLTAKDRVSDVVEGFDVGANDYLTKPFSRDELLSRIKTHINLSTIHRASTKFVPIEFIRSVGRETINEVVLGDHIEKEVTVVFSDIREYTKLAESMTPTQNFKFVNSYVGKMGPLIQRNDGFVNQYLGDGIMALFPKSPGDALQSAIDMQRRLITYNLDRKRKGYAEIGVGIGLHTGSMVLGIIGDQRRNDTAIIADAVNTASRMEGLTKHYGAKVILSQESYDRIENRQDYHFRRLGQVKVVGKQRAVGIYECYDGDSPESIQLKEQSLESFDRGLQYFSEGAFKEAIKVFSEIYQRNPEDGVARYFAEKSELYNNEGVPADWTLANTMTKK